MKTLGEISFEAEQMLIKEFGRYCNYCNRYDALRGICKWDDEPTRSEDGERCMIFELDQFALKELRKEHLMATQFGMIPNLWKEWIENLKI